jgi:Mrp family chromosome partitioning ATPase/capsule polysaccharide export protein KpsE/RkpR
VEDQDPKTARDLANAVAENYIIFDANTRLKRSRDMLEWLNKELFTMKKNVEDAEQEFQAYKEQRTLFSFEGKQGLNVQKIQNMSSNYLQTRSTRLTLEAKIEELEKFIDSSKHGSMHNIPMFFEDNIVGSLYSQLLTTEVERKRISEVFKHKHPEMIKVTSKIEELRRKIREQTDKALDNARSERAVLIAREKALKDAIENYEKETIDANRNSLEYTILEREVETNRQIYNTLLSKIKEANIVDEITRTNLRLVDPANLPGKPVRPKKGKNMILGVIYGLLAGVGLAFALEYLDQTINNREETERYLNLPLLSEVPKVKHAFKPSNQTTEPSSLNMLTQPLRSHFSEAFKTLVTNLRFLDVDWSGVYLITSSTPGEGKSTVCFNLARTMAQLGKKALFLDTDLRLPMRKKRLGLNDERGLSEILVDTFSTPILSGTLGVMGSGDLHRILELQEKSGVLRYETDRDVFNVSFQKGKIVSVDWPSRSKSSRLGNLLLQCGKITKEQAQFAIARQQGTSQRLGKVLLNLGFLTPEELAGPLKLHLGESLRALGDCQNNSCKYARFAFEENNTQAEPTVDAKESVLQKAIGDLDGFASYPTPYLDRKIHEHVYSIPDSELYVMPGGGVPPNPIELLASSRMRVLLDLLKKHFDVILLDSPPVGAMSDAAVLASQCEGVMLVIKAGITDLKQIRRGIKQLEAVDAQVDGVVLNMIDRKKDPYYYKNYVYKYENYYSSHDEK